MNYEEACECVVTKAEAKLEVEAHHCEWSEFLEDVGEKDKYIGQEVLDWLGY